MGNIKLQKLFATLESQTGMPKNLTITSKNLTITINGDIHKFDDHYCFMKGLGKVLFEHKKTGSMLSWKGTYKAYVVKFVVGDSVLAEFEIPKNAKLELQD
jgi:hypothetical protein